jgi:hypothetical protein
VWNEHVLPGLAATGESWANAVDHVPASQGGEWTLVVGAAMDESGTLRPMKWDNVSNQPWNGEPLTPAGVSGEAFGVFIPDGIPLRAFVCGWVSDPPTAASVGGATPPTPTGSGPCFMPIGIGGTNFIFPEFPAALDGAVYDIASSDAGVLMAVGGGENSAGEWRPQLWESLDDGLTWSNEELPLPLGVQSGEAMDCDHEVGHWLGAGWGAGDRHDVPLLWDLDTNSPSPMWVVHELPLPALDVGGVNASVHKRPGRVKYSNIVLKQGINPEAGIWIDNPGGGWTLLEPADYLLNPEVGTPLAPAGIDKLGRVAVKFPNPPASAGANASGPSGTIAGSHSFAHDGYRRRTIRAALDRGLGVAQSVQVRSPHRLYVAVGRFRHGDDSRRGRPRGDASRPGTMAGGTGARRALGRVRAQRTTRRLRRLLRARGDAVWDFDGEDRENRLGAAYSHTTEPVPSIRMSVPISGG